MFRLVSRVGYGARVPVMAVRGFANASDTVRKETPGGKEKRVEFTSSEQSKEHKITQRETPDGKKVTVPPKKWSEDYASHSESAVKADKKDHKTIEEMQKKTIDKLKKEEKLDKKKPVEKENTN
eukprot:TRINITY_DN40_c0_g1_i2.p1 TRINITY_DN40_c0_g1~~TRINITY_DN40_c0_g1_i2.p1  ORF type:complete len:144 (+),score=50.56 TRINITY_DN40_c0_g1_i2:61-432(+)